MKFKDQIILRLTKRKRGVVKVLFTKRKILWIVSVTQSFFFFLNLGHRVFFICSCIAQTKGFMLDFVCLAFFLFMYIACLATS